MAIEVDLLTIKTSLMPGGADAPAPEGEQAMEHAADVAIKAGREEFLRLLLPLVHQYVNDRLNR